MCTILVADDEPFIIRSLAFMLRKEGHEVITADNGAVALEFLQDTENRKINLAFLDIMMPKLTGFEVIETLQQSGALITPIIFLTAKGMEEDRERGYALGATDFLTKPFSPSAISVLVKNMCEDHE